MPSTPIQLAVLLSGGGTTLQNLIDRIADGSLDARVNVVVASKPNIAGIARAQKAGIPAVVVDRSIHRDLEGFSDRVFAAIEEHPVDLVVLGGWLSLLKYPDRFAGRVMNVHPALLPAFGGKGMYGRHVHEAVIAHGCKVSGCTVHYADAHYDTGPIILQRTCPVLDDDTPQALAARVFEQECIAYPHAITLHAQRRLRVEGRRVRVVDPS